MSDPKNTIATIEEAKALPDGQWAQDADGTFVCLMDTHMGWPQRMAMPKGGRSLHSLEQLVFPLHLCDLALDEPCPHKWGLIGEGHCRRCGELIDWRPMYLDGPPVGMFQHVVPESPDLSTGEKP
jgi:hypothetical protein